MQIVQTITSQDDKLPVRVVGVRVPAYELGIKKRHVF